MDRQESTGTGAAPEVLTDPQVRASIDEAKRRIAQGGTRPGMSADDLLRLADEQARLEA